MGNFSRRQCVFPKQIVVHEMWSPNLCIFITVLFVSNVLSQNRTNKPETELRSTDQSQKSANEGVPLHLDEKHTVTGFPRQPYKSIGGSRTVLPTLYFRSKSRLLQLERTIHDEIHKCTVYTGSFDDLSTGWDGIISVTEEEMVNMVGNCRLIDHLKVEGRRNRRNTLVFPGYKWCGQGDVAEDENDLSTKNEAVDSCCRTHDNCSISLLPFTLKYGLFNLALWTTSGCDCDLELYSCLKSAGDVIIGTMYFNLFNVACIEQTYEDVCVNRTWRGCHEWDVQQVWTFRDNDLNY